MSVTMITALKGKTSDQPFVGINMYVSLVLAMESLICPLFFPFDLGICIQVCRHCSFILKDAIKNEKKTSPPPSVYVYLCVVLGYPFTNIPPHRQARTAPVSFPAVFSFASIICQRLYFNNCRTWYFSKIIQTCWWTWVRLSLSKDLHVTPVNERESALGRFFNAVLVKHQSILLPAQLTDNLPKCPPMSTGNVLLTRIN